MIRHTASSINTNLLAELAGRAIEAYPASAASIRKAHTMALSGAVTLTHDGAFVESATTPGVHYRVAGKTCSCPATTPLCCHRFAVALLRKYQAEESLPEADVPARPKRYYAWLNGKDVLAGEAEEAGDGNYTFYFQGRPLATTVPFAMLTLLGEVTLAETQRRLDGSYIDKVCGR